MRIYRQPSRIDITTDPTGLPVSVSQVKERARMDAGDSMMNASIEAYIKAIWARVEEFTGMTVLETTFKAYYDGFPIVMRIPAFPKFAVKSIKYYDEKGVLQTLSTDVYQVKVEKYFADIFTKDEQAFPSYQQHKVDCVCIEYTAGNLLANVPKDVSEAIIHSVVAMLSTGDEIGSACSLTALSKELLKKHRDLMALMRDE